jgi:hypothetical protein
LNIVDVAGQDIHKLWKGFIITKEGIQVGLTDTNTRGHGEIDLPERQPIRRHDA